MQGQLINYNGKTYNRTIEMLGDVQKITWFERHGITEQEIYDQELMNVLEAEYETILWDILTPTPPII